ncbi:MAG: hypothetical protein EHM47_03425 [Ignavibacteriales bacterium]|nr:MAG: hypothetical protein EHM47_03425 [Ignavibacteriales bacterium]
MSLCENCHSELVSESHVVVWFKTQMLRQVQNDKISVSGQTRLPFPDSHWSFLKAATNKLL